MGQPRESWMTRPHHHLIVLLAAVALVLAAATEAPGQPTGEAVMAWHVTIAPTWFDPSTAPPQITPFGILFALHDALVRPLPNQKMGNSLAESWTESPDGLVYEFKLRRGVKFHNGDALTAEDVKFSFERYKGTGAKELQARVESVEIADPLTVRFRLKAAWPDFMTYYGTTATAAGIVFPKKYMEKVGDEGFRKHPIGAGPYKFVSHMPGVEVVLEAYTGYWRRVPNVKRLIMKSVPEGTTRVAMLKKGEADIAYALDGQAAEGVINDLKGVGIRVKMRLVERATFYAEWGERKLRGIFLTAVGNSGNAASRVEAFMYSKGSYSYGGYPDIDELFLQQARERDSAKREAVLHRIQQLAIDRAMFAPLMDLRALTGIGPRMAEHTINLVPMSAFPSYEDMRLK